MLATRFRPRREEELAGEACRPLLHAASRPRRVPRDACKQNDDHHQPRQEPCHEQTPADTDAHGASEPPPSSRTVLTGWDPKQFIHAWKRSSRLSPSWRAADALSCPEEGGTGPLTAQEPHSPRKGQGGPPKAHVDGEVMEPPVEPLPTGVALGAKNARARVSRSGWFCNLSYRTQVEELKRVSVREITDQKRDPAGQRMAEAADDVVRAERPRSHDTDGLTRWRKCLRGSGVQISRSPRKDSRY